MELGPSSLPLHQLSHQGPAFLSPHALFQLLTLTSDLHGEIKPGRAQYLSQTVCGDSALDLSLYFLSTVGNLGAALRSWADRCLENTAGRLSY